MNRLTKVIFTFLLIVTVAMGYSTATMADSKSELIKEEKKQIIELVQEIEDLGETPIKKYLLQNQGKLDIHLCFFYLLSQENKLRIWHCMEE